MIKLAERITLGRGEIPSKVDGEVTCRLSTPQVADALHLIEMISNVPNKRLAHSFTGDELAQKTGTTFVLETRQQENTNPAICQPRIPQQTVPEDLTRRQRRLRNASRFQLQAHHPLPFSPRPLINITLHDCLLSRSGEPKMRPKSPRSLIVHAQDNVSGSL